MQKVNVYGFGIQRQSQIDAGHHLGDSVAVVANDPESARAFVVGTLADDLANISGPTLIVADAFLTDGAGSGDGAEGTPPPANTSVPYCTGAGIVGGVLNCTMGNWTGEPTSYAYQWKRDGTDVGSDSPDYLVQTDDLGRSIACVVTASNAGGSVAAPASNAVIITAIQ